jgi:DNA gyrase inhibitor GyrI
VEELAASPVERDAVEVMFIRIRDDLSEMRAAWERLEGLVGTRGRKFFGAFYPPTKEYRVCVQIVEGDDATALGLEVDTLPGGRYLRARLRGEPPGLYDRIGPAFDVLSNSAEVDETRPSIEFYRRRDEVDVLLPIPG